MSIYQKNIKNTQTSKRILQNTRAAFTLIELIVVIAIIGLLASVVTTSLGKSRTRAEIAKVQTDYKSVSSALELYRQANGGYPGSDGTPMSIQDLVTNNLSQYIKQVPSVSPAVVLSSFPDVYYQYNSPDVGQLWCGDVSTTQDYVLYFVPTQDAIDSGFFPQLLQTGGSQVGLYYCIPVNQK